MSKADLVVFYCHTNLKAQYKLGNEAYYDIGGEPLADPLASDCSGLVIGAFQRANVRFYGRTFAQAMGTARATAHDMYRNATRISQPSDVGDLFFRVRNGHAYHVGIYVGHGYTIESGDGTGQTGKHTVAWQNDRGVVWGRFPGNDIGKVTASGYPSIPDWPGMYLGSYGRYVRELKTILNYLMGAGLTTKYTVVGNTFGPATLAAVKKFQRAHKQCDGEAFANTGRVGPETKAAMVKAVI